MNRVAKKKKVAKTKKIILKKKAAAKIKKTTKPKSKGSYTLLWGDQHTWFSKAAEQLGMTKSNLVKLSVEEYVARHLKDF